MDDKRFIIGCGVVGGCYVIGKLIDVAKAKKVRKEIVDGYNKVIDKTIAWADSYIDKMMKMMDA